MLQRLSSGRKGFVVPATLVSALLLCSLSPRALSAAGAAESVQVVRVVDGDTLVLRSVGTVRLIGIDTPETVDPRKPVQAFGMEATAFLRQLVQGQPVRVEYDTQRFDKYGRTLAYLYLPDDSFVNLEMVRQGYAHAYLNYPFRHMEEFRGAEREAREAGRGLWGQHSTEQSAVSAASVPMRVWVNTSSRVYHCPGTRYYGNTARGEYMTESEAQQSGNRAAYGRSCGPASAPTPVETSAVEAARPTSCDSDRQSPDGHKRGDGVGQSHVEGLPLPGYALLRQYEARCLHVGIRRPEWRLPGRSGPSVLVVSADSRVLRTRRIPTACRSQFIQVRASTAMAG